MKVTQKDHKLVFEEQKAVKLFLWLFYIFFTAFELFWVFVLPNYTKVEGVSSLSEGIGYWRFALIVGLLPISIYLLKKRNPYIVKYFLLTGYLLIDFIDNFVRYYGTTDAFASGNVVEVLFVFYSPMFINKRFYWTVVWGFLVKHLLIGLILLDPHVINSIVLHLIFSVSAFILINRFLSYINSFTVVQDELHQKEKLAAIGQMATVLGHEIRNPLSTLKGFTQLQRESYPNTNDYYPIMIQEIDRINTIVNDLLFLGKPKSVHFEKESIYTIISYIGSLTQNMAEQKDITISTRLEEALPEIECDESQLKQVLLNLIKNAIESMDDGKIEICVRRHDADHLYISIQDEGSGISDSDMPNLGKAFFTTKSDGTGLGLLITNQIINDHQGQLNFKSEMGIGTIAEIVLPITQKKS